MESSKSNMLFVNILVLSILVKSIGQKVSIILKSNALNWLEESCKG